MQDLFELVRTFGLPPLVQLILVPFALLGIVVSIVQVWDKSKEIVRHRLTHWAKYDLLEEIRTGVEREYIESLLGSPVKTFEALDGDYDIALYKEPEYILKLVYNQGGTLSMYSVTVCDESFKPSFRAGMHTYRLGECTYSDVQDARILYATYSSKDIRYAESTYLANPGDYQDLLLATHWPPGIQWDTDDDEPNVADLCHELHLAHDESRQVIMGDELVSDVRKRAKPNSFGFAAMGFDHAGTIAVGAVYAHTRALYRKG